MTRTSGHNAMGVSAGPSSDMSVSPQSNNTHASGIARAYVGDGLVAGADTDRVRFGFKISQSLPAHRGADSRPMCLVWNSPGSSRSSEPRSFRAASRSSPRRGPPRRDDVGRRRQLAFHRVDKVEQLARL